MVLTSEQQLFLHVLKDYILERPTELSNSFDWKKIKSYADNHQLSAIFYYQTHQKIFEEAYAGQIHRSINYKKEISLFKTALQNYKYLMVKGVVVSTLYPIPSLRSMGDVDVLIHLEDRESIHNDLINHGFELYKKTSLGEWVYSKRGFFFEVHDSLVHRYKGKEKLVEYFSSCWEYEENGLLDWSDHLIYLIEHLRQHFVGEGVGFRQFMDIAIVCKKCAIDWDFVSSELKKIDLYDFASTVFAFIYVWFDIEVPFVRKDLTDDFYIASTNKIFENGVFGFDNEENSQTALSFQMLYKGIDFKKARKQYFLEHLFPDYETMTTFPHCSYIKKYKFLLPISWIHRILYCVFNHEHRKTIQQQFSKKQTMERMKMLKQWGLE